MLHSTHQLNKYNTSIFTDVGGQHDLPLPRESSSEDSLLLLRGLAAVQYVHLHGKYDVIV